MLYVQRQKVIYIYITLTTQSAILVLLLHNSKTYTKAPQQPQTKISVL